MTTCSVSPSCGNVATPGRLRQSLSGRPRAAAFTLMELIVVVAIISLLSAFLFPTYKRMLASSQLTTCLNNLRQTGTAIHLYAADHDNRLPGPLPANNFFPTYRDNGGNVSPDGDALYVFLWPYLPLPPTPTDKLAPMGVCPSVLKSGKSTAWLSKSKFFTAGIHAMAEFNLYYPKVSELPEAGGHSRAYPFGLGSLHKPWPISNISRPAQFALLGELPGNIRNTASYNKLEGNELSVGHKNEATILFLDGHVISQPAVIPQ